jgi:hypothetical protein
VLMKRAQGENRLPEWMIKRVPGTHVSDKKITHRVREKWDGQSAMRILDAI